MTTSYTYKLVIVESPAKCKKIEQYLNVLGKQQYKCIACWGHIRELAGLEAIDIHHNFAPTFIECESKKSQIRELKKAIKEVGVEAVILASDDDREGEAIAWHLCQVFGLSVENTPRLLFHEITESAISRAIVAPARIRLAIVNAQLARQVLDLLVGYKLSPLLWKHVQDGLSAGRCQTPALRLLYENQCAIDAAPGKQSYTVTGYFTNKNIPFILNKEETDEPALQAFLQASLAFAHQFQGCKLRLGSKKEPLPFTTSTLQQSASNDIQLSPKETMKLAQELYEGGYITYPRTDGLTYSGDFEEKIRKYIVTEYGKDYYNARENGERVGGEGGAHEAIRPTNIAVLAANEDDNLLTGKAQRLYHLIRQRTLESCMPPFTFSALTATITAPENNEYRYTTEQPIFPGWQIIRLNKEKEKEKKEYTYLQALEKGQLLPYKKIKAQVHLKEIKAHYSEARLVQLLEEEGIGRPSTFASLIEKIQERKYVKKTNVAGRKIQCREYEVIATATATATATGSCKSGSIQQTILEREFGNEKNKLVIQPVGILSLDFLLKYFEPFFQYSYTRQLEDELDAVARGEKVWYEVCRAGYTELTNLSQTILEKGKESIRIDAEHVYVVGKYGPVIKCTKDKKTLTFKAVRTDIDLNKLRRGEYSLTELLLQSVEVASIGMYQDKPVYIKVGKFGIYLEWNNLSKSLKHIKKQLNEISLDDVADVLFDLNNTEEVKLRSISDDASIRKGKYGDYIYYKTTKMKKPRFLKLTGFIGDYLKCELGVLQIWFNRTYDI